jgi:hypothetical protein
MPLARSEHLSITGSMDSLIIDLLSAMVAYHAE